VNRYRDYKKLLEIFLIILRASKFDFMTHVEMEVQVANKYTELQSTCLLRGRERRRERERERESALVEIFL